MHVRHHATLLEVAGASYPKTVNGQEPPPLIGNRGQDAAGEAESPRPNRTTWRGRFRQPRCPAGRLEVALAIQTYGTEEWELFNLRHLAEPMIWPPSIPRGQALLALWDDYVRPTTWSCPARHLGATGKAASRSLSGGGRFPPLIYQKQFIPPPNMLAIRSRDRTRKQNELNSATTNAMRQKPNTAQRGHISSSSRSRRLATTILA